MTAICTSKCRNKTRIKMDKIESRKTQHKEEKNNSSGNNEELQRSSIGSYNP